MQRSLGIFGAGILSPYAEAQTLTPTAPAASRWTPASNIQKPADVGVRAHTFLHVLGLPGKNITPPKVTSSGVTPMIANPPFPGYAFETPQSAACVYGLVPGATTCNPNTASATPSSTKPLAIAIVDAYDNPSAASDWAQFSAQFGLTGGSLTVVYASGAQPLPDLGWALKSSLDIEWAHAMSPTATVYLVEAATNSFADLGQAIAVATSLVSGTPGGVVSMSWGGSEFPEETSLDSYFSGAKTVTYLASSGDAPGVEWPSASPYVVGVGGTSLSRSPYTGNFEGELTWQQTGGGVSYYEARPSYQSKISTKVGAYRGVPDIAAVADPDTGVWVYSGYNGGWWVVGGTSVASPLSAGILSWKGVGTTKSQQVLTEIYTSTAFRDITAGNCGPYAGWIAAKGWDPCTGMGSIAAKTTKLVVTGGFAQ